MDGKGYPNRQTTTAILLAARATAIADAFDSMVRGSIYRISLPPEYALLEIIQNGGKQFDPLLIELIQKNCDDILLKYTKERKGGAL